MQLAETRCAGSGDPSIAHRVVGDGSFSLGLELRAGLHSGECEVVDG